jgi:hypothetical protein
MRHGRKTITAASGVLRLGLAGAALCLGIAAARGGPFPLAFTLDVGESGSYVLGDVLPELTGGSGGQQADAVTMVNQLTGMPTPSTTVVSGAYYGRSANAFGTMPAATTLGDTLASGGTVTVNGTYALITLPATEGYHYLVAEYGAQAGAEVWDIAGIAPGSTIQIPEYAEPGPATGTGVQVGTHNGTGNPIFVYPPLVNGLSETKYKISNWTLLNPTTLSAPDGGSTALLLGIGLLGLSRLRKRGAQKN